MAKLGVLDLGSGYLKIVIADGDENPPTVLAAQQFRSKGINKGVIVKTSLARKVLKEALKQMENLEGDELKIYYILLSHPATKTENIKVNLQLGENPVDINEEHLTRLEKEVISKAKENGYEIIHIVPKFFYLDGEKYFEPLGLWASRIEGEYFVVKIPSSVVRNTERLLTSIGYKVGKLIFPPLAASQLLLNDEEEEINILIVDIGYTTSSFLYIKDGSPTEAGVIGLGVRNIAENLAKHYRIPSLKEIERLMEEYGFEYLLTEGEEITETVKIREDYQVSIKLSEFVQLFAEQLSTILESILLEAYKKGINLDRDIDSFVFVGGFAAIKGLKPLIEGILEKEVIVAKPVSIDSMEPNMDSPIFTPAVGALLLIDQLEDKFESFSDYFGIPEEKEETYKEVLISREIYEEPSEVEEKKGFFKRLITSIKRLISED